MKQVLLKKHQRKLIRLFRKNVVNDPLFLYDAPQMIEDEEGIRYCIRKLVKGSDKGLGADNDIRILKGLVDAKKYPVMRKRLQQKLEEKYAEALENIDKDKPMSSLAKTLLILKEMKRQKTLEKKKAQKVFQGEDLSDDNHDDEEKNGGAAGILAGMAKGREEAK
jgi:hypothetical protein